MYRRGLMMAAVVVILVAQAVLAFGAGPFAGEWQGTWSNSVGESGPDTLVLSEDNQGNLTGVWTGNVEVWGRMINPNTVELQGRTGNRSYQITATINDGEMYLSYNATRLDSPGSYRGEARLSRVR